MKTVAVDDLKKDAKKEKEPTSFILTNPSRVIPAQVRYLTLPRLGGGDIPEGPPGTASTQQHRYLPVDITRRSNISGIVILVDEEPNLQEVNLVKVERIQIGQEDEAPLPQPFIWDPTADVDE